MSYGRSFFILFLFFCLYGECRVCRADIYQHMDEDGVTWFTDNPQDERFRMVLRERQAQPKSAKRAIPRHLTATGVDARLSDPAAVPEMSTNTPPTLPIQGKITSMIGLRQDPIDGKLRHHNGVDIAAPSGTPVKPVAPGVVVFSGTRSGYGNMVIIDHQNGTLTVYAHHSTNLVQVGDQVTVSSIIALSGSTGRSTGPHLHFEAWQNGENITATYLPGNSASQSASVVSYRREAPIRRMLQDDGTLLFTNLR
jgi:murein DD-endopeptidase MepM/ murein hydrolase activator NlpD